MRVGRIPYVNCYPVYGGIDRGSIPFNALLVDGVPTKLNQMMADGSLDISVVSAVEYARDSSRYLLLPDLAISCDGPVNSVMLFSKVAVKDLGGRKVLVSRSSMTSVALLELLFAERWKVKPDFVPCDAEITDIARFGEEAHDARLVIGDAALILGTRTDHGYSFAYDLGEEWKAWTDLPFVFAVWVAQRNIQVDLALAVHASLIESRNWGLEHIPELAQQAADVTGVGIAVCNRYLDNLDYGLSYPHLAGLTEFFRRLVARGQVPDGRLAFLPAA
ncbi:MAG: menaquinone biosynthesis protein [Gemmatimonadaceae bacterium]|nr:menaquinone biosynthesis protein [Gemmatimonadaceae bacterium]